MPHVIVGNMATNTTVKFDSEAWKKAVLEVASKEQTARLIAYANKRMQEIGDKIKTWNSKNNLDRTGNLLNSLCWAVTKDGKLEGSGFYRPAITRPKGVHGSSISFIHEFTPDYEREVNGRALAESYLANISSTEGKGWRVYFAILAPYWGYWESGFTLKSGGGSSGIPSSSRYLQFQVMCEFFDKIRMDLKPAKTHLTVHVEKYSYKSNSFRGKKRKVGYRKFKLN